MLQLVEGQVVMALDSQSMVQGLKPLGRLQGQFSLLSFRGGSNE